MAAPAQNPPGVIDVGPLLLARAGRIGRRDYWFGAVLVVAAYVVLSLIPVVGMAVALITIWGWICLHSKRLHDVGLSARWQAPAHLLSVVSLFGAGFIVAANISELLGRPEVSALDLSAQVGISAMTVGVIETGALWLSLLVLVTLGAIPGQAGDNPYGAPPRGVSRRW